MAKKTGELQSILGIEENIECIKDINYSIKYSSDEHVRMEENRQRSAINLERLVRPTHYVRDMLTQYVPAIITSSAVSAWDRRVC